MVKHIEMPSIVDPEQQNMETSEQSYSYIIQYMPQPSEAPSGQGGWLW